MGNDETMDHIKEEKKKKKERKKERTKVQIYASWNSVKMKTQT